MTPVQINIIGMLKAVLTPCMSARYWRGVLAIVFILAQGFTVSHAAQYNNAPHEHNGVACEITLIAPDADIIEPPTPEYEPLPRFIVETVFAVQITPLIIANPCRAPPGRGPPNPS